MILGARQNLWKTSVNFNKDLTFLTVDIHDGHNELTIYDTIFNTSSNNFSINWGDRNTETFSSAGTKSHTYAKDGQYLVVISNDLKSFRLGVNGDTPNRHIITSIQKIGSNFIQLPQHCFRHLVRCTYLDASNANFTSCSNAEFYSVCNTNNNDGYQPENGHIILPATLTTLGGWTFEWDNAVTTLTFLGMQAPTANNYNVFGTSNNSTLAGYNTRSSGINELRIHRNATGYQNGMFGQRLLNSSWCNFHITYID